MDFHQKRLIFTSVLSILLVSILLIGSTYSIFNSTDIDEEKNVYKTANLDITYTLDNGNVILDNPNPMKEDEIFNLTPYRLTITNTGNVPYLFQVILDPTTAANEINHKYIMTKVGELEAKPLSSCEENIIKKDVIVPAGKSVPIDVRVWISDQIQNTEMGKSFYAKLKIDGVAVYEENQEIDNTKLTVTRLLSQAKIGSYVKYIGNNGCEGTTCEGKFEESTSSNTSRENGWRIGYINEESTYLINAKPLNLNNNNLTQKELSEEALKYCNNLYIYQETCNQNSARIFSLEDFTLIKKNFEKNNCPETSDLDECSQSNDLINPQENYLIIDNNEKETWFWNAKNKNLEKRSNNEETNLGLRFILRLKPDIVIKKGSGTSTDPYIISNEK